MSSWGAAGRPYGMWAAHKAGKVYDYYTMPKASEIDIVVGLSSYKRWDYRERRLSS